MNECDTNTCATPYAIKVTDLSDTAVTFKWQGFENDAYIITFTRADGSDTIINTTSDSIHFNNLLPCSTYKFNIKGNCTSDTSSASNTITIQTDGCCYAPDLILNDATPNSFNFTWNTILNATKYVIRYKLASASIWNYDTLTGNNYLLQNLDTCSDYELSIKSICTDSTRDFSTNYSFSTLGCGICFEGDYCSINSILVNSSFEWIESITLKGVTVNSGNNSGYYDGGVITDGLLPDNFYTISFEPGYAAGVFTEHYSLWLDLDQNGTFESSEKLIDNLTGSGAVSALLIIPNTSIHGITKMRIAMNGVNAASKCADEGGNIYGEYEDYCIQIGGSVGVSDQVMPAIKIYPNPTNYRFSIASPEKLTAIKVINTSGQVVANLKVNDSNLYDISHLSAGSYYIQMIGVSGISTQQLIKY
ncbi:GEVED domain-containing protein [Putridiphycobacter roseus]